MLTDKPYPIFVLRTSRTCGRPTAWRRESSRGGQIGADLQYQCGPAGAPHVAERRLAASGTRAAQQWELHSAVQ